MAEADGRRASFVASRCRCGETLLFWTLAQRRCSSSSEQIRPQGPLTLSLSSESSQWVWYHQGGYLRGATWRWLVKCPSCRILCRDPSIFAPTIWCSKTLGEHPGKALSRHRYDHDAVCQELCLAKGYGKCSTWECESFAAGESQPGRLQARISPNLQCRTSRRPILVAKVGVEASVAGKSAFMSSCPASSNIALEQLESLEHTYIIIHT